jgi:hypothetical protein
MFRQTGQWGVEEDLMKFRKITGSEREQLLSSRKPSGFNYQPYLDVLDGVSDGDVVAVEVARGGERGEKIRFSRAARLRDKSLNWLASTNENEITFQVGPAKAQRTRSRKSS